MREKDSRNANFFSNAEQRSGTIESVSFSASSAAAIQSQSLNPLSTPPSSSGSQVSSGAQASSDETRTSQRRRMSTDGGIRIAGGPPGADDDVDELDDSMTLPPEYRQY